MTVLKAKRTVYTRRRPPEAPRSRKEKHMARVYIGTISLDDSDRIASSSRRLT